MGYTPDDLQGGITDADKVLVNPNAGETAGAEGEVVYNSGSFAMRDSAGVFDPRSGGGGLSEAQHEALDRLTHNVNESGYEEFVYTGNLVTAVIFWTSSGKTQKIREELFTYTGNKVTQIVTIQYDGAGVEKERITQGTFNYTGTRLDDNTWTKT